MAHLIFSHGQLVWERWCKRQRLFMLVSQFQTNWKADVRVSLSQRAAVVFRCYFFLQGQSSLNVPSLSAHSEHFLSSCWQSWSGCCSSSHKGAGGPFIGAQRLFVRSVTSLQCDTIVRTTSSGEKKTQRPLKWTFWQNQSTWVGIQ